MKPSSPAGQAISAVEFAGVSAQMPSSGQNSCAAPHRPPRRLLQLLIGSPHTAPSRQNRVTAPDSPPPHGLVTASPSYAALQPSSAGHTAFGTAAHRRSPRLPHAVAVSSPQRPSASQNRCFSPKNPVPHGTSAVDSAGVSGQAPSAGQSSCTTPHRAAARPPQPERSGAAQFPPSSQARVCSPVNPAPQGIALSVSDGVCGQSPVAAHWFRTSSNGLRAAHRTRRWARPRRPPSRRSAAARRRSRADRPAPRRSRRWRRARAFRRGSARRRW